MEFLVVFPPAPPEKTWNRERLNDMHKVVQEPVTESGTECSSSSLGICLNKRQFLFFNEILFWSPVRWHFSHIGKLCDGQWIECVSLFQLVLTVYLGMVFHNSSSPLSVVSCTENVTNCAVRIYIIEQLSY